MIINNDFRPELYSAKKLEVLIKLRLETVNRWQLFYWV